uniref:Cathepsin propeptide inhibitor domain-containing protein n=1 Tax=Panagrolaimus sp. PS1159 TaxID=55785 RepID=A0AC35FEF6_9BILA
MSNDHKNDKEWQDYKQKFDKSYPDEETEKQRYQIYKKNIEENETHNKRFEDGKETYQRGTNQFTDKEPHEVC